MPRIDKDIGPKLVSVARLLGDDVRNYEGEELGSIKDVMLDMSTGEIAYIILSAGGILGIGEKLMAIPWYAFEPDPDARCLRLGIDKESLKEAPGFDKDEWPDMASVSWGRRIHDYFRSAEYHDR
ncbi:MAG TPA: PRC-barrel domain-containing protein [Gammaproteobacteria bacterium]